ncbi:phosphate ABC transporter permease PstA [Salisediminibacterium selenitireducens]|uniref:Phosphate transport system permease protein PstA n=1 Tax=Bacillus selenitireducens (strain ATCC 700615 / DSM 15326 / MLS10) TaxID=439292 RepID=D6XT44_BACIE|nr:phosphate ABC transporter permease PstA [Salisediminibacterium selenitireducens]ADH98980.1 phosphate ABC transporter, inner membrane subunit PstA [[Bacillus] selenitireducens MLS10]
MKHKQRTERIWFTVAGFFAAMTVVALGLLLFSIIREGASVISWSFITEPPRRNMTEGGIWPALVGTFYVASLTVLISVPVGIGAAIYLNEYARQGKFVRLIRLSIRNLAGVPSIVYGLFGLAIFASFLRIGVGLITAAITLAIMVLPWVITASEEALKSVPASFREGGLALGATKWQTIRQLVLPSAVPGMMTGSILGLARAAGETAPIILTGAAYYSRNLPTELTDSFMALPYHLYILATQHAQASAVRPIAYGTALVLIMLVILLNLSAILIRNRFRNRNEAL